jgi:hypothetical protein
VHCSTGSCPSARARTKHQRCQSTGGVCVEASKGTHGCCCSGLGPSWADFSETQHDQRLPMSQLWHCIRLILPCRMCLHFRCPPVLLLTYLLLCIYDNPLQKPPDALDLLHALMPSPQLQRRIQPPVVSTHLQCQLQVASAGWWRWWRRPWWRRGGWAGW